MSKHLTTLLIIGGFLVGIVLILFLFVRETPKQITPLPTPTPNQYSTTPVPRITISGISLNNFLSTGEKINSHDDILVEQKTEYEIVYLHDFNEFIITVHEKPFEEIRKQAEQAFLDKLGISKQEACALSVSEAIPFAVDPNLGGQKFKLSFCE